mmetsp:Transcript_8711/g.8249  ORF Transcript_8711/g.8249 Transcript_8711/m.8249 type:complete len:338 (-) Transcript_8711:4-1017(-)
MYPNSNNQVNFGMGDKMPQQPPSVYFAYPIPIDQFTNFQNQMGPYNILPVQLSGMPGQMIQFPQHSLHPSPIGPGFPQQFASFPQQLPMPEGTPQIAPPTPQDQEGPIVQDSQPQKFNQLKEDGSINNTENNSGALSIEPPRERWKRKDDKEMFAFLRDYCMKTGDTIDNISQRLQNSKDKDHGFWVYISNSIKWKGPLFMLQKRFQKLCSTKGLSIREKILLRKLYDMKKKSKEEVTLDSILYHFPGRTLEDLQIENLDDEINGYFAMFKNPNHYHMTKYKDNILFKIDKVSKNQKKKDKNLKIKIDLTKVSAEVVKKETQGSTVEDSKENEVIID